MGRVAVCCVLGLLVTLAGACGGSTRSGALAGTHVAPVPGNPLGAGLLGLVVTNEDITPQVHGLVGSWLDEVSLYGLRTQDHLLQATLELGRFSSTARYQDPKFQLSLVNGIGGAAPRQVRVAGTIVYLTTATRQQLAVWVRGRWLAVLAIRQDYPHPRALLRAALGVRP